MTVTQNWTVRSDKDTSYTTQIVASGIDIESFSNLPGNDNVQPVSVEINRVTVLSDQNLSWDVMLFRNNTSQPNADLDLDAMVHWVSFANTDAVQVTDTADKFRYSLSELNLKYNPDDRVFHVGLINRDTAAKNPGASGEVVIELQGTF